MIIAVYETERLVTINTRKKEYTASQQAYYRILGEQEHSIVRRTILPPDIQDYDVTPTRRPFFASVISHVSRWTVNTIETNATLYTHYMPVVQSRTAVASGEYGDALHGVAAKCHAVSTW